MLILKYGLAGERRLYILPILQMYERALVGALKEVQI